MKRKNKIYLLNSTSGDIRKASGLASRLNGISYVSVFPLNHKIYFAFTLDEKLSRKIKISKLNNKIRTKNLILLNKILNKCRVFKCEQDFEKFKELNKAVSSKFYSGDNYYRMPKNEKKDNQKIHDKNLPDLDKMSKSKLIKMGTKISGIKIRHPRKTANRRTWKNFIERFYNKEWHERNH